MAIAAVTPSAATRRGAAAAAFVFGGSSRRRQTSSPATAAMTTVPCVAVSARSTSRTSPSPMPASCIALPAARITKVASGWRMRASLRSTRRTVESAPGDPKALEVRRGAGSALAPSRPAGAPSSKSG